MHILIRQLGTHRGAPRLYIDSPALELAGLRPGATVTQEINASEFRLTWRVDADGSGKGSRKVSRKVYQLKRGTRVVPVLDINSAQDLAVFAGCAAVRIVIQADAVHILLPASAAKALARLARLSAKLALGQPLTTAGLAFGAGIASKALHDGLAEAGVSTELVLANELCEDYVNLASQNNPVVKAATTVAAIPMQELAVDDWLLQRLGSLDILEAGIPCSGASKAGRAKRRLAQMEDHPLVGHLIGAALQVIARLQPALVLIENVESYRHTASATILRGWLRDAGYAVAEVVLDAADFGSLEARVRWFLVAHPPELDLDLDQLHQLRPPSAEPQRLADVLEPIGPEEERFRTVEYLKAKAERDAESGSGFAMQWLTPDSSSVPTLRKGYHKGGSTDPRLLHPTDPSRSRLLTGLEHARIKGVDEQLVAGACETVIHQVCGQAVDTRPVVALGRRIGQALKRPGRVQLALGEHSAGLSLCIAG